MKIKPSTYIRNDYADLSSYCRETGEPVYITKNGEGDVVVQSIEAYERQQQRLEDLEFKLYLHKAFREAEEYNKLHPKTYTMEEFEQRMEDYANELQRRKEIDL